MVKSENRLYFLSYVALMILLVSTLLVHVLALGWVGIILSLGIALAKAAIVMRNFMELRLAQKAVLWYLGATLFLLYIAALLSFSDYLTRLPI